MVLCSNIDTFDLNSNLQGPPALYISLLIERHRLSEFSSSVHDVNDMITTLYGREYEVR